MDCPLPQPHLYPHSSKAGMLDQFVIHQAPSPSLKAPLNFGFLYPNLVLRLLKVHAAAHPSVYPYPNSCFRTLLFTVSFFSPYPMPSIQTSDINVTNTQIDIGSIYKKSDEDLWQNKFEIQYVSP